MTSQTAEQEQPPLSFWEAVGKEYWQCEPVPTPPDQTYREYESLRKKYGGRWRYLQQLKSGTVQSNPQEYQKAKNECEAAEKEFREHLCRKYLHKKTRSALCLSGGGIRSAVFGLGVLQGLAKHSWKKDDAGEHGPTLLSEFDYLSTVSGGGYVGSWFSAWARREKKAPPGQHEPALPQIVPESAQSPEQAARTAQQRAEQQAAQNKADQDAVKQVLEGLVATPDADPVFHLRRYSNYLTPQMGVLSADTWTWVATFIRNMFLNWLVALPVLAAILLIPKLSRDLAMLGSVPDGLGWSVGIVGILAGAVAYAYLILELPSAGNRNDRQGTFLGLCLLPLSIFAWCLSLTGFWLLENAQELEQWKSVLPRWPYANTEVSAFLTIAVVVFVLATILSLGVRAWSLRKEKLLFAENWNVFAAKLRAQMKWLGKASFGMAFTTVVAGIMIHPLFTWLHPILGSSSANKGLDARLYTVFAFPIAMLMVIVTQALLVGLLSLITTDDDREWWGRAGGWLYLTALGWMAGSALVLFAAQTLDLANHAGRWAAATIVTTLSGAIASALGFSNKTQAVDVKIPLKKLSNSERARKWGLQALLLLFLLLLVPTLASVTAILHNWITNKWQLRTSDSYGLLLDLGLALMLAGVSCLMARFINTNKFSMHGMYRARLIRAFLGASNKRRTPNWFTGFDPKDNLSMHELVYKPLHVVNMSLNLVRGGELAWQERKAESFTTSALHTGSMWLGYQPSDHYGRLSKLENEPDRISLGSAVAVSGAAATPNMGYHSSPLLTAVMTLFNARLGAWLPNPGEAGHNVWEQSGPTFALTPFYDEAFGLTDDSHEWAYLSDGGHFENLGLYEMVARRCHYILAIDAGCDPNYQCEDLIKAMRKIRTDLGIPIEFSDGLPFSSTADKEGRHYAIGRIHYSHVDPGAQPGVLVYVKPSLVGNEPRDVLDYHRLHSNFPQQPTTDQWFEESQFESYRCLGEFVVHEILQEEESHLPTMYSLDDFFTIAARPKTGAFLHKLKAAVGS